MKEVYICVTLVLDLATEFVTESIRNPHSLRGIAGIVVPKDGTFIGLVTEKIEGVCCWDCGAQGRAVYRHAS